MGFRDVLRFSLGSRQNIRPSRPYLRVCVLVAVYLSTETSLYSTTPCLPGPGRGSVEAMDTVKYGLVFKYWRARKGGCRPQITDCSNLSGGNFETPLDPFALGFGPKSAHSRPQKPGPGTVSAIKQRRLDEHNWILLSLGKTEPEISSSCLALCPPLPPLLN